MAEIPYPLYPNEDMLDIVIRQRDRKDVIVSDYLASLCEDEIQIAENAVETIFDASKPLGDTVVIIPVAAAQEAANIPNAVAQYARQKSRRPFSLVLGLNLDYEKHDYDDASVLASLIAVRNAKIEYPDLDIRSSLSMYLEPTIGAIRRDMWNSVLLAKSKEANIPGTCSPFSKTKEMVGINNDIDVLRMPQRYVDKVQRHYEHPVRSVGPSFTQLKHARDPNHPVLSRALFWYDFVRSQAKGGYEASLTVPMSFYALEGGIHAGDRLSEVLNLVGPCRSIIRTGHLETSPRRFVERLGTHGFGGIWTEDSFGPNDNCRVEQHISEKEDISPDDLSQLLVTKIPSDIRAILNSTSYFTKHPHEIIARKLAVAKRALHLVFPDNKEYVDEHFSRGLYDHTMSTWLENQKIETEHFESYNEH